MANAPASSLDPSSNTTKCRSPRASGATAATIGANPRPEPPATARILARDREGRLAVFQVGTNALGFTGHPGTKAAIVEDLIMEFEEGPADPAPGLAQLRSLQRSIEDALVPIMTGVVKVLALMD